MRSIAPGVGATLPDPGEAVPPAPRRGPGPALGKRLLRALERCPATALKVLAAGVAREFRDSAGRAGWWAVLIMDSPYLRVIAAL